MFRCHERLLGREEEECTELHSPVSTEGAGDSCRCSVVGPAGAHEDANDWFPFMKLASDYDLSADIMLAYQADIFNTFKIGGQALKLKLVPLKSAISKLNVMVFESETDFELRFEYRNDLFKEETIRSFADSFLKIVEQFLKKSKLCEVELVNENQLAELDNFNKTEFPFDDSKPLFCREFFCIAPQTNQQRFCCRQTEIPFC